MMSIDQRTYDTAPDPEQARLDQLVRQIGTRNAVDYRHELRVRLLCGMLARRIDAGPANASPVSRRQRVAALLTHASTRAFNLDAWGLPRTQWVSMPNDWFAAWGEARDRIKGVAALNDGQPLSLMFPMPES